MKTTNKTVYCQPTISQIDIDNEISLVLVSDPPFGPGEVQANAPDFFNQESGSWEL